MADNSGVNIREFLAQLAMMPGMEGLNSIIKMILGEGPFGLNWLTVNNQKSLPWNLYTQAKSRWMSNNMLPGQIYGANMAMTNVLTNAYMMAGYDLDRAKAAAASAANSPLGGLAQMFIAPQLGAAYSAVGNAFYKRLSARDMYGGIAGSFYGGLIKDTLEGKYAGLNLGDTGVLAGQLIGSGAFEYSGSANINQRIEKVKKELTSYAQTVGVLKDVIDGPIEKILQEFEAMTGTKLTSMSTGRAAMLASSFRQAVAVAGVSPQQIAQFTATQYAMIAPYGGTLAQANAMAIATASAVGSGVRIEGLADVQLGQALAKNNAQQLLNGNLRRKAAAYQHWRSRNGRDDNEVSMAEFMREWGGRVDTYLAQNNVSATFMSSQLVTNTMANTEFLTSSRAEQFERYQRRLKGLKGRLDPRAYDIITNEYDPSRMLERLMSEEGGNMSANEAAQVVATVSSMARQSFQTRDTLAAFGMAGTAKNAELVQRKKLAEGALNRIRGLGFGQGGVEGILAAAAGKPGNLADFAQLLIAYTGANPANSTILSDIQKVQTADELKALANEYGMSADVLKALLGKDVGYQTVAGGLLMAESAKNNDGTPKLSSEKLKAVKKTAIESMLKEKNMSYERARELTKDLNLTQEQLDAYWLAARGGGRAISKQEVEKLSSIRSERRGGVETRLKGSEEGKRVDSLKSAIKTAKKIYGENSTIVKQLEKQLNEAEETFNAKVDAETSNEAREVLEGQAAVDIVRAEHKKVGKRMNADETAAFIADEKNTDKNAQRVRELAKKQYLAEGNKEEEWKDKAQEFIKNTYVNRGGVEEFLQGIFDLIPNLIKVLEDVARKLPNLIPPTSGK